MASATPNFGLDAELAAKAAAKYDHALEKQVQEWIEGVTGETMGPLTFAEWLNDGVVLCQLVNAIRPGTCKINKMKAPFKKMENIKAFTDAARNFGVVESAMFATPDLYEEKNMGSVVNCIYTFASVMQTVAPDYKGPKLGIAVAASKDGPREKKAATQTGGLGGHIEKAAAGTMQRDIKMGADAGDRPKSPRPGAPALDRAGSGDGTGSKGLGDGTGSKPASGYPRQASPRPGAPAPVKLTEGAAAAGGGVFEAGAGAEADAQGLDADLKKKMAEKFDPNTDRAVCEWIEAVTGEKKGDQSTAEYLRSGQVLCELANKIQPGCVKGVSKSNMPFNMMENIKKFLGAARGLGMAESSLFSTPDLFEEKNMGIVVQALFSYGGVVQTKVKDFRGPHLGVAIKSEVNDKSRGIGLATDQNEAFQRAIDKGETRMDKNIR